MSTTDDEVVVSVSEKGQATIPKRFRDEHGITAPGKVRFRENDDGEIVVEPVPTLREMRGVATVERPGTEILRERRADDENRDGRLRRSSPDG